MNQRLKAIHKNGVLHPLEPVNFADGSILEIKIIEIIENSADYIKDIKKDLSELEINELDHLEKEIDDNYR